MESKTLGKRKLTQYKSLLNESWSCPLCFIFNSESTQGFLKFENLELGVTKTNEGKFVFCYKYKDNCSVYPEEVIATLPVENPEKILFEIKDDIKCHLLIKPLGSSNWHFLLSFFTLYEYGYMYHDNCDEGTLDKVVPLLNFSKDIDSIISPIVFKNLRTLEKIVVYKSNPEISTTIKNSIIKCQPPLYTLFEKPSLFVEKLNSELEKSNFELLCHVGLFDHTWLALNSTKTPNVVIDSELESHAFYKSQTPDKICYGSDNQPLLWRAVVTICKKRIKFSLIYEGTSFTPTHSIAKLQELYKFNNKIGNSLKILPLLNFWTPFEIDNEFYWIPLEYVLPKFLRCLNTKKRTPK